VGLANIQDPRYLDLTFSQVQGNMGLSNMPELRHMDLAVSQVYGNTGLTIMPDLKYFDFAIYQVQGTWTSVSQVQVGLGSQPSPLHLDFSQSSPR